MKIIKIVLFALALGTSCFAQQYAGDKIYITLTAAQIKSLRATPITLIPSPNTPGVLQTIDSMWVRFKPNTTAFGNTTGITLEITQGTVDLGCGVAATGLIDQAGSQVSRVNCAFANKNTNNLKNSAVTISLLGGSGELTLGDGTVEVYLDYEWINLK